MAAPDTLRDTRIPLNNGSGAIPAWNSSTKHPRSTCTKDSSDRHEHPESVADPPSCQRSPRMQFRYIGINHDHQSKIRQIKQPQPQLETRVLRRRQLWHLNGRRVRADF